MGGRAARDECRLRVHAPARLHLGFLDLNGGLGRRFGSIGLALDEPVTELEIRPAADLTVAGPEADRVRRCWLRAAHHLGVPCAAAIKVVSAIPAHAGFGSGTQMALAAAAGVAWMHDRSLGAETARALERGNRSGIGIAAFFEGGLIVDGGRKTDEPVPPIVTRLDFPAAWRVLLLLDPQTEGIHGPAETAAFGLLAPFPEATADRICRVVLMQVLPAVIEADLPAFSAGIGEIQSRLGDHFAPAQGGRYTSPRVAAAMAAIEQSGITGTGQSSWGPTGFAFVESEAQARDVARWLTRPGGAAEHLQMIVARGRNGGATFGRSAVRDPLRCSASLPA